MQRSFSLFWVQLKILGSALHPNQICQHDHDVATIFWPATTCSRGFTDSFVCYNAFIEDLTSVERGVALHAILNLRGLRQQVLVLHVTGVPENGKHAADFQQVQGSFSAAISLQRLHAHIVTPRRTHLASPCDSALYHCMFACVSVYLCICYYRYIHRERVHISTCTHLCMRIHARTFSRRHAWMSHW